MLIEEKIEEILDSLRKVAFYVGHGKYNDYMSTEEVNKLKAKFEKILEVEKELEKATFSQKEDIYNSLKKYTTFSVKDFIDYKI